MAGSRRSRPQQPIESTSTQATPADSTDPLQEAGTSSATIDPTLSGSTTEPLATGGQNDLDTEFALVRQRIEQLERLQQLQAQEAALREALHIGSSTRPRNPSPGSNSSGSQEVKVKNLTQLTRNATLRKREDWINDLQRAFAGAPRRYRKGYKKILLALDQMDVECRARWDRYLDEKPTPEARHEAESDWARFKEWTLTLVPDSAHLDQQVAQQVNRAQQRPDQSPRDFHLYLDSLEKHLPRQPEVTRALTFYAKLLPSLQDSLNVQVAKLPENREELVAMSTRVWEATNSTRKRKSADHLESSTPARRAQYKRKPPPPRREWRGPPTGRNPAAVVKAEAAALPGNPRGSDGRTLRCYNCNSENHLAPRCPEPKSDRGKVQTIHRGKGRRPGGRA